MSSPLSLPVPKEPPQFPPYEIEVMYWDMWNRGMFHLPQIGGPTISLDEWRERELKRWAEWGQS